MTDLLDVNVWLALADSDHTHHGVASTYWMEQEASEVAFCRVSMMGFLRLIVTVRATPSSAAEGLGRECMHGSPATLRSRRRTPRATMLEVGGPSTPKASILQHL